MRRTTQKARKGKDAAAKAASDPKLSLKLFKSVEWPDVLPVKLKYDDFRAVTAVLNQGLYVYRINSVFDPDFTGVGGQPGGFDQLKALYGRYRVMGFRYKVELEVLTASDSASLVAAPTDNSAFTTTAEALADLRHASNISSAQFGSAKAKIEGMYHVGELLGYSDESMLANSNMDAAVTANPAFQQFLFVGWETSGAATAAWLTVTLEYYVRMEVPIAVQDSMSKSRFARLRTSVPTAANADVVVGEGAPAMTTLQGLTTQTVTGENRTARDQTHWGQEPSRQLTSADTSISMLDLSVQMRKTLENQVSHEAAQPSGGGGKCNCGVKAPAP